MQAQAERRHAATEVQILAAELMEWLSDHCDDITIGGSLRRGRADVKDVELIVRNPRPSYFDELDSEVERGTIAKKLYGATGQTRWGDKYRGIVYHGVTFELFVCDDDNAGYITWLRTGPGDANQYLVTQLKYRCKTWRVDKGYLWTIPAYSEQTAQKLHVPTEQDFFDLCGLPFMPPSDRREQAYRKAFGKGHAWGNPAAFVPVDVPAAESQRDTLFDMPEPVQAESADVRHARNEAERLYALPLHIATYKHHIALAEYYGMDDAAAYYRQRLADTLRVWSA